MKLYYYKSSEGINNFGDNLNPWLWKQLIPDILDDEEDIRFIGIGTLLHSALPDYVLKSRRKVIFSSGVYYKKGIPNIDDSWTIYCLRGPLSARTLGVSTELAVTDGALLVRRLFRPTGCKVNRYAFMPHVRSAKAGSEAWNSICKQCAFGYIDPRWPIEKVLSSISHTEILLTEAMHGAIVANALGVPWIPIRANSRVLRFKWWDWCLSISVEYQPRNILQVWDPPEGSGIYSSGRHWMKKKLIAAQLAHIAKTSRPTLSNDSHLEQLTFELEERLQQFRDDVAANIFHK